MPKKIDFPSQTDPLFATINKAFNIWTNRATLKLKKIVDHESKVFVNERDKEIFIEGATTYYKRVIKMLPLTGLAVLYAYLRDFFHQHDMDKNIESQIDSLSMKDFLFQQKKRYIKFHLDRFDGDVYQLAQFLDIDIKYAYKICRKHNINVFNYTSKHVSGNQKVRSKLKRKVYYKRKRKFY